MVPTIPDRKKDFCVHSYIRLGLTKINKKNELTKFFNIYGTALETILNKKSTLLKRCFEFYEC